MPCKEKPPVLSVVIPAWNRGANVFHAVRSIALQCGGRNVEIIVVDDASTDNTIDVVRNLSEEFGFVRIECMASHGGAAAARNAGLRTARGSFVWFVDSDDFVAEGALDLIWPELQKGWIDILRFDKQNAKAITSAYHVERDSVPKTTIIELRNDAEGLLTCLSMGSVWNSVFSRRAIGTTVFDESFSYGEDAIFTWTVALSSRHCIYIHAPLYGYMETPRSLTSEKNAERFNCYMRQVVCFSELIDRSSLAEEMKDRLSLECCWRVYSHAFGCFLPEEIDDGMWNVWREVYRIVMVSNRRRACSARWLSRLNLLFLSKTRACDIFKSELKRRSGGRSR